MFRFSFDLGTNSIGWAIYELDAQTRKPKDLIKLGVRIFSDGRDPQNKESNAKGRREPRSHRRQHDRRLKRRMRLLTDLETSGLMPPAGPEIAHPIWVAPVWTTVISAPTRAWMFCPPTTVSKCCNG